MTAINYLDRDTVIQALKQANIQIEPQDAGLAWVVLINAPEPQIEGALLERRFNLLEITFPKTGFSVALNNALTQSGLEVLQLVQAKGSLALTISNPLDKPESILLHTLERTVPGYRLRQLVTLEDKKCGVLFDADLVVRETEPIVENDLYEVWTDGSLDQALPTVVGCGYIVKKNGKLLKSEPCWTFGSQKQTEFIAAEMGLLQVPKGATVRLYVDAIQVVDSINNYVKTLTSNATKFAPNIKALPRLGTVLRVRNVEAFLASEANSTEMKQVHNLANQGRKLYVPDSSKPANGGVKHPMMNTSKQNTVDPSPTNAVQSTVTPVNGDNSVGYANPPIVGFASLGEVSPNGNGNVQTQFANDESLPQTD